MGWCRLWLLVSVATCCQASEFPWLDTLDASGDFEGSGRRLMALAPGASRIDRDDGAGNRAVVAVHGFASRGYEWVYPLQVLDSPRDSIYFYRWDWEQCPETAAQELGLALEALLASGTEDLVVIGHSYGGTMVAVLASKWQGVALEVHAIAAPLASLGRKRTACQTLAFDSLPPQVSFTQWRTRHDLDGAFKDMARDPQDVEIKGARVVLLPRTYRDRRLGHNWSISWVAENFGSRGAQ